MFEVFMHDPQVRDLLIVLLTAYPIWRILGRLGLPRWPVVLSLLSVVIPLLGHMLVALYVVSRPWPKVPLPPKPAKRVRV